MEKIKKKLFDGSDIEILGPTYEPGKPEGKGEWKNKMQDRNEYIKYLKQAERYWYNSDWFGSEKRKNPA
jgi:hypothetical protein